MNEKKLESNKKSGITLLLCYIATALLIMSFRYIVGVKAWGIEF